MKKETYVAVTKYISTVPSIAFHIKYFQLQVIKDTIKLPSRTEVALPQLIGLFLYYHLGIPTQMFSHKEMLQAKYKLCTKCFNLK